MVFSGCLCIVHTCAAGFVCSANFFPIRHDQTGRFVYKYPHVLKKKTFLAWAGQCSGRIYTPSDPIMSAKQVLQQGNVNTGIEFAAGWAATLPPLFNY
jgi:hypothetical protein